MKKLRKKISMFAVTTCFICSLVGCEETTGIASISSISNVESSEGTPQNPQNPQDPSTFFEGDFVQVERSTVEAYAQNTQDFTSAIYTVMVNNVGATYQGEYVTTHREGDNRDGNDSLEWVARRQDMQSEYTTLKGAYASICDNEYGYGYTEEFGDYYYDGQYVYSQYSENYGGSVELRKQKREVSTSTFLDEELNYFISEISPCCFTLRYLLKASSNEHSEEYGTDNDSVLSSWTNGYGLKNLVINGYWMDTTNAGYTKIKLSYQAQGISEEPEEQYDNANITASCVFVFDSEYKLVGFSLREQATAEGYIAWTTDSKIMPYVGTITPPTNLEEYLEDR